MARRGLNAVRTLNDLAATRAQWEHMQRANRIGIVPSANIEDVRGLAPHTPGDARSWLDTWGDFSGATSYEDMKRRIDEDVSLMQAPNIPTVHMPATDRMIRAMASEGVITGDAGVNTLAGGTRRTARSVVDVIAAEAGNSLSAMKDVASAIYNRARELGVSAEDVVSVKSEFNAYGGPQASHSKRVLAAKAFAAIMKDGPTHKGTFYAQPGAVHNLPKGLTQVKVGADRHHYFVDPKNRAIKTAAGFKVPNPRTVRVPSSLPETVAVRPTPRPANTLAAMGTPRSMIAGRPEVPGNNLSSMVAGNAADVQRMERQEGMYQPSAAPNPARFGPVAPNPDRFGPTTLSDAARVQAAQNTFSRMHPSTQEDALAHLMDAPRNYMADNVTTPKTSRLSHPGVTIGQDNPAMARELDRQMMAGLPQGATDTPVAPNPAEEDASMAALAAVPSYAATPQTLAHLDRPPPIDPNYANTLASVAAPALPPPIEVPTRRVAAVPSARRSTMRGAPTQRQQQPDPLAGRTLAGVRPTERFSVNSVTDALNGRRGATAFSRSMPGVAVINRGPNIGTAIHNTLTGATTLFSPTGGITGVRFDGGGSYAGGANTLGGASSSSGGFGIGGGGSTRTGNSR